MKKLIKNNTEIKGKIEESIWNENIDNAINNLRKNKFKIYFYCPSTNTPSGGMGILLRAAKNLNDNGYDIMLVYEPRQDQKISHEASVEAKTQINIFKKFSPNWVDFDISRIVFLPLGNREITFSDGTKTECIPLSVNPEDFLIIPEGFPDVMKRTIHVSCKRIILAQSWFYVLNRMQPGEKWQHFGIQDVISISDAITEYLNSIMPGLKIKNFKPGINRDIFKVPAKNWTKKLVVAFIEPRGLESQSKTYIIIKTFYALYPYLKWVRFKELKGMKRKQFAECLASCVFYLSTDDIAGFGTAPLEAMASGIHTVGWASFGEKEYITTKNGFWCENGDIFQTAKTLGVAIDKWLNGDMDPKQVQEEYEKTLSNYTIENEKKAMINIFNGYKNERIKELKDLKQQYPYKHIKQHYKKFT